LLITAELKRRLLAMNETSTGLVTVVANLKLICWLRGSQWSIHWSDVTTFRGSHHNTRGCILNDLQLPWHHTQRIREQASLLIRELVTTAQGGADRDCATTFYIDRTQLTVDENTCW